MSHANPADAVREAPTELDRIIAEMRDTVEHGDTITADVIGWTKRLAALAGAAPVAWQYRLRFNGKWEEWSRCPLSELDYYRTLADCEVRPLFTHAPAKAREDVLLPLLRDMWAETVSHAEMWGQRPDDALRDRYLAALATFAEGDAK